MSYDPQSVLIGTIADANPSSSNDSTQGFRYGSVWINRLDGTAFLCTDAGVGGAVWTELGSVTDLVSEFVTLRDNFRKLLLALMHEGFELPDCLVDEADQADVRKSATL